jgi:NAD(P)-dependent dehydrogenase (short-subunit alcohol dehydrogenase family)
MDVVNEESVQAAAETTAAALEGRGLAGLINNAGIAVSGPLMHLPLAELRHQFDVNVMGLVAVTQAFLPLLGAGPDAPQPPGRIINISSVSGHTTYPFLAPYAASKRALEAISEGLRRELMIYGIDVSVMVLGAVRTPIWDKSDPAELDRYAETDYAEAAALMRETTTNIGRTAMPVEPVAKAIRLALEASRPKTRYVLANNWLLGWIAPRWLPDRLLDWAITKQLGLTRRNGRD